MILKKENVKITDWDFAKYIKVIPHVVFFLLFCFFFKYLVKYLAGMYANSH